MDFFFKCLWKILSQLGPSGCWPGGAWSHTLICICISEYAGKVLVVFVCFAQFKKQEIKQKGQIKMAKEIKNERYCADSLEKGVQVGSYVCFEACEIQHKEYYPQNQRIKIHHGIEEKDYIFANSTIGFEAAWILS